MTTKKFRAGEKFRPGSNGSRALMKKLGIPYCTSSSWNTLVGLGPIQCYTPSRCRWHFFGMCYCPMPEKYGYELAYPVHFLYRKCLGKYRDYLGQP